jgi:hypothetical protein
VDQNQARSRSRKNQIVRFPILEGPVFIDKVESEYGLRFCLFRKDLVVYESKSCVLLPIYIKVMADCKSSPTKSIEFTLFILLP